MRYSVRATPLPLSVAAKVKYVSAANGPTDGEIVVVGGVSSSTSVAFRIVSWFPRRSAERYSTNRRPSKPVNRKSDAYRVQPVHVPLHTRYSMAARPTGVTPPSVAANVSGAADVTNVSAPSYFGAPTVRVVPGGVVSTRKVAFAIGSTFPSKSSLNHSTVCAPSTASVNGPVAVKLTHGPRSTRYVVFRIPVPPWSRTENDSGVAVVTYVGGPATWGLPTTRVVSGSAVTFRTNVYTLFVSSDSGSALP